MVGKIVGWAQNQDCGTGIAKSVLLSLADRTDSEGRCFPSVRRIAQDTHWCERTVRYALRELEKRNLLRIEVKMTRRGQSSNIYILNVPAEILQTPKQRNVHKGAAHAAGNAGGAGHGLHRMQGLISKPQDKPSPNPLRVLNARGDARVEQLIVAIGAERYASWIDGAVFVDGPPARIQLSSPFRADRVRDDFLVALQRAFGYDVIVECLPCPSSISPAAPLPMSFLKTR